MTGRYCDECGKWYEYERVTSQYCGEKCRVDAFRRRNAAKAVETGQELAKIYVSYLGSVYRVKAFQNTLWVERQPNGSNIPFSREDYDDVLYGDNYPTWHIENLQNMLEEYDYLLMMD